MTRSSRPTVPAGPPQLPRRRCIGRCEVFEEVAQGGMATIYLGRWRGAGGFSRPVAIKALHPQFARDAEFRTMLLDEARVVARINHPNVMPTLDLIEEDGELFIVMEYVLGATLSQLAQEAARFRQRTPPDVVLAILSGTLMGLHAAHEARSERGEPLRVIHRDVSPENILVGADGLPRLLDFGIARALGRCSMTRDGEMKGKISYMAPEQVLEGELTARTDIYGAAVVLWQVLTGRKLFRGDSVAELASNILRAPVPPPSTFVPGLPPEVDAIVLRGLARNPARRWETAQQMAAAIDELGAPATRRRVASWVTRMAAGRIEMGARQLRAVDAAPLTALPAAEKTVSRRSVEPPLPEPMSAEGEVSHTDVTAEAAAKPMSPPATATRYLAALAAALALVSMAVSVTVGAMRRGEPGAAGPAGQAEPAFVAPAPPSPELPPTAISSIDPSTPTEASSPSATASASASAAPPTKHGLRTWPQPRRPRAAPVKSIRLPDGI